MRAKVISSAIAVTLCGSLCFVPYFGLFAGRDEGAANYTAAELLSFQLNATRCPSPRCVGYENFTRDVPLEIDEFLF